MPKTVPKWLSLKCNEKLVYNPASLFSQSFAAVINGADITGYTDLECVQHLCLAGRNKNEPVQIVYSGRCTILGCWISAVSSQVANHDHIEGLRHYKFWNSNTRNSRRCIAAAFPFHPDTTIQVEEFDESKRPKRISETSKRISCKRKLFE